MPRSSCRTGQNIRELALKRRVKAVTSFASAGLILLFPFFLVRAYSHLLKLVASGSAQPQPSPTLPIALYILFGIVTLGLIANGFLLWKRANLADQGAKGETAKALEFCDTDRSLIVALYRSRI